MAASAEEIRVIRGTISSAMGESAGQFRQAATASTASLSKIVKDIARTFAEQRKDLADLSNNIGEQLSESEQFNNKLDRMNSSIQELISVQVTTQGYVKSISSGVNYLYKGINDLENTLQQSISGLGGTGLGSIGEGVAKALQALGIGAAAGVGVGAGMTAAESMLGGGGAGGGGAGGGGAAGGGGKVSNPVMAKDIYNYLTKEKGIDHAHAVGMLANIQNESRFNSGAFNKNDVNGPSGGLFQHHDNLRTGEHRFTDMTKAAGPDWQRNWKGQIDFALSEKDTQNYLKRPVGSGEEAAKAFVYDFERPKDKLGEATKRAANVPAIEKLIGGNQKSESSSSATTGGATPGAMPVATTGGATPGAIPAATTGGATPGAMPVASTGAAAAQTGKDAEKVKGEGANSNLPSGDIVALGHALEKMGMRISEHPQFGGVKPVHKGKAHYEGRAIDINFGQGKVEANDPVMGAKFDQLAAQLTKLGYKVFWRESGPYGAAGHNNHLHAEIPRGGSEATPDRYQIPGTPENQATQGATPLSGGYQGTPGQAPSGAGVSAEPMGRPSAIPGAYSGVSAPLQNPEMQNIMGMMGMMKGMMPGNIGGMLGMAAPMLGMLMSSMQAPPAMAQPEQEAIPQETTPQSAAAPSTQQAMMETPPEPPTAPPPDATAQTVEPPIRTLNREMPPQQQAFSFENMIKPVAEFFDSSAKESEATRMINQTAIQEQAQQQSYAQQNISESPSPSMAPGASANPNQMAYDQPGYAYNYPSDVGWPDWVSAIGGNHWPEMRKIKKNMWG